MVTKKKKVAKKKAKKAAPKRRPGAPKKNTSAVKHGLFGSLWRKQFTEAELAAIDAPIGAVEMAEELVKLGRARLISAAHHLDIMSKDGDDEKYEKAQRLYTNIQTEARQAVKTLVEAQAALGDMSPPLVEATIAIPGFDGATIVNPHWRQDEIQQADQDQDGKHPRELCALEISSGESAKRRAN